jgi:hypothetical protein
MLCHTKSALITGKHILPCSHVGPSEFVSEFPCVRRSVRGCVRRTIYRTQSRTQHRTVRRTFLISVRPFVRLSEGVATAKIMIM